MSKTLLKNIIVAVNGSQSSIQAAMYGILLAKQYHLSLKAVYVVDTATIKFLANSRFFVVEERVSYEESLCTDGGHYLEYVKNLAKTKGVTIETELRKGSVSAEVIAAADEYKADLILLGGRAEGGVAISGTGARRNVAATARLEIVETARRPVLVVHKPEIETLFKMPL